MKGQTPSRTLFLHIGLPKTATTYLQSVVFPAFDHLAYFDRLTKSHHDPAPFLPPLTYFKNARLEEPAKLQRICDMITALQDETTKDILLACENYSMGRMAFWNNSPVSPEVFAAKLKTLKDALPDTAIKIILGTRQADQWMGSRYAQSSRGIDQSGQADFDKRVADFCEGEITGAQRWLIKGEARSALLEVMHEDDLFYFEMETFLADAQKGVSELAAFLGHDDPLGFATDLSRKQDLSKKKNDKGTGASEWKLINKDETIKLSAEQSRLILEKSGWR